MQEFREIHTFSPPDKGTTIALGRFDGVHIGHRILLETTVMLALSMDAMPCCFSFQEETYRHDNPHDCLTTSEEKAALIEKLGIETLLHPPFEKPFIDTTADVFVNSYLLDRWKARHITVGFDFRFGKDRKGNSTLLWELASRRGVQVDMVEPVKMDGEVVKSTAIRTYLRAGDIPRANRLLGRPYSITQRQVPGQRLGTGIGFPTLNFNWPECKVMPPYGVYAVRVGDGSSEEKADGVAGFGLRPTVEKDRQTPILEVHLLEPEKLKEALSIPETSSRTFTIEFFAHIRPERKFDSIEALRRQIAHDCDSARQILFELT